MENYFTAAACDSGLCAADRLVKGWRERISLSTAIRDYKMLNNPPKKKEKPSHCE